MTRRAWASTCIGVIVDVQCPLYQRLCPHRHCIVSFPPSYQQSDDEEAVVYSVASNIVRNEELLQELKSMWPTPSAILVRHSTSVLSNGKHGPVVEWTESGFAVRFDEASLEAERGLLFLARVHGQVRKSGIRFESVTDAGALTHSLTLSHYFIHFLPGPCRFGCLISAPLALMVTRHRFTSGGDMRGACTLAST